ncbi:MAG TPA: response regulator, partial [Vicinamibacterales bacterium]
MSRVLLVEDDRSLGKTLAERLAKEGIDVQWVETLASGRQAAQQPWDLAIVDVMLPDGSGFDLAPEIRRRSLTPIMFMTALN